MRCNMSAPSKMLSPAKQPSVALTELCAGHIHCAEIRQIGDVTYYNDGDWVESSTALVEAFDGTMSILDWSETHRARRKTATNAGRGMRIAIATDAWFPQTNGVVRSLATTISILQRRGYEIEFDLA